MLAYFPTEQLYYLRVHDIIPAAVTLPVLGKTVALNARKLLQVSSRFYLAYVVLEFFRLKERSGLLYAKEGVLRKANVNSAEANVERAELKRSWNAHTLATAYNTFRFPGALHWYVSLYDPQFVLSLLFASYGSRVEPSTLNHPRLASPSGGHRLCFYKFHAPGRCGLMGAGVFATSSWLFLSSIMGKIFLHEPKDSLFTIYENPSHQNGGGMGERSPRGSLHLSLGCASHVLGVRFGYFQSSRLSTSSRPVE